MPRTPPSPVKIVFIPADPNDPRTAAAELEAARLFARLLPVWEERRREAERAEQVAAP